MTHIVDAARFRTRSSARGTGGSDAGNMDDVLRRLGIVESSVTDTREDVNAMETRITRWIVGTTIAAASVAFTIANAPLTATLELLPESTVMQ